MTKERGMTTTKGTKSSKLTRVAGVKDEGKSLGANLQELGKSKQGHEASQIFKEGKWPVQKEHPRIC